MTTAHPIRGHTLGSFFNRITRRLADYTHDTLRAITQQGKLREDYGEPVIHADRDAEAFLGAASIDCEVDMKPLGLGNVPLKASYSPSRERIDWQMHSAYITSTPGTWTPEEAASALTPEKLRHAHRYYMGEDVEPLRPPAVRGR